VQRIPEAVHVEAVEALLAAVAMALVYACIHSAISTISSFAHIQVGHRSNW
jgi:hypothetical protein